MVELTSAFWAEHLLFRDYLRTHPATAANTLRSKRRLAAAFGDDRMGYTDAKGDFIQWRAGPGAGRAGTMLARATGLCSGPCRCHRHAAQRSADLHLRRGANTVLTRWVFGAIRRLFALRLRLAKSYGEADNLLALYAPLSLLALPPVACPCAGRIHSHVLGCRQQLLVDGFQAERLVAVHSGLRTGRWHVADDHVICRGCHWHGVGGPLHRLPPTIYAAFTRREREVSLLEVRAGSPPSAVEMIIRYHRIHGLDRLHDTWQTWEVWFADIEESHTSLAALSYFRSPPG